MADVQAEVRAWLHTQKDWLQEAADRLLQFGFLDDTVIAELSELLKTSDGRKVTNHREFRNLGNPVSTSNELRLVSIGEVQGIENLSPRTPLAFGKGNLVVVYGNNGSGKSSYTRILKKVCGKPRAQDVKPNVFQPAPAVRQCLIRYSLDGNEHSTTWPANTAGVEELLPIDIFDGDIARFYLSSETEASYMPPVVSLFEVLASVCARVGGQLQQEQHQLVTKLPLLSADYIDTSAGKPYRALKPRTPDANLKPITEWTEDAQELLEQLTERLKAKDSAALARQKRAKTRQIAELRVSIDKAAVAVNTEACKQRQALNKSAKEKRQQAIEAAKIHTTSAKLDGIGTDTWVALWNAARSYSMQTAYPEKDFPVTEEDARCVLCHQTLDTDAKSRLKDFEAYVQGKMEAEADKAERAYKQSLEVLPRVPSLQEIQTSCQAAGLDEGWFTRIASFWTEYGKVHDRCATAEPDEVIQGLDAPSDLLDPLRQLTDSLEAEVTQHDADTTSFDREKAAKQKIELEAKRWTAQQAAAIHAEVKRLNQVAQIESWRTHANSRNISLKAGEISKKVITGAYVDRFNDELKALGASRIKVELVKTRTEKGKVKHRLQLRGVSNSNHSPGAILSDGERRAVSLAAFLADVTGKPYPAPFIFDDPISSLDHDFEWEVAMRLAKLAQDRQVIVFTHRLSLYGAMEDAAKKLGVEWKSKNLVQLCIEAFGGTAGHPVDEAFWNANTKKANNILINRLNEAKKFSDIGDSSNYRIRAQGICTDFRKLLERTVEEDLLNQIVKRHRRSVTTDNRITQLPKITKEDCEFIDELMTKYSCYEHSQSHETPMFLPDETELRQDIDALKTWREKFGKRPIEAAS